MRENWRPPPIAAAWHLVTPQPVMLPRRILENLGMPNQSETTTTGQATNQLTSAELEGAMDCAATTVVYGRAESIVGRYCHTASHCHTDSH
jgi:hypothetical protein